MASEANPVDNGTELTGQPVSLALLFALAIAFFVFVTALSRAYHRQQDTLAINCYARGFVDLNTGLFGDAVNEFRTALRYSPDNFACQLGLAEALLGLKRTVEARTYLSTLRERQPDNGTVNLLLARVAAEGGRADEALRFYHNAIYAIWPSDQEVRRRDTRLELIAYLLNVNAKAQAQSELIALAASLNDQPEHALAAFRSSMKSPHRSQADLVGAGAAAFELGRYPAAQRYLQAAAAPDPHDPKTAAMLRTTELVLQMDPFQRRLSSAQRSNTVMQAFTAAGVRLTSCGATHNFPPGSQFPALVDSWTKMKPRVTERRLRQNPDLAESVMELVFSVERQTAGWCGAPTESDTVLLLIAKLHEGN